MGEAKLRQAKIVDLQKAIKVPARKRLQSYRLVHHRRIEEQGENGMVYARNVFAVVDDAGRAYFEETPDGPAPVLISSIRQPIRRSVLAASGLVTR